jgi:endoglucanase
VIRAAMGVEEGGYLSNPFSEYEKITRVIDACIEEGIYVIVDWHDHHAHENEQSAIAFFTQIASQYGDKPNIIYEIYNEPLQISWSDDVKPYSERVITEIRKIDSNNIILVGSPTWAQDVDIAANDPLEFENIAYSLHFYAATHKQSLRLKAQTALNRGAALFVSEFGTCESNGSGFLDYTETNNWIDFLEENNISWVNWSIADKDETSAALLPGANSNGGWGESEISESGMFIRAKIRGLNTPTKVKLNEPDQKLNSIQNYPNPFNNSTKLKFVLEKPDRIKLDVYNLLGEYVYHIFDRRFERGEHIYALELSDLPSGMYLLSYQSEESNEILKIQLMK